jgi:hypothetical protein
VAPAAAVYKSRGKGGGCTCCQVCHHLII